MMGPSHSMSGAAAWLGLTAVASNTPALSFIPTDPTSVIVGTMVAAGAALAPDIDSYGSTVVRSFGIFGRIFYTIANGVSLFFANLVRTGKDETKDNGHRTLFHTILFAGLAGFLTYLAGQSSREVEIFDQTYSLGTVLTLVILGIFLHLGLGGLFVKPIAKARSNVGPYIMMLFTVAITLGVAWFMNQNESTTQTYPWLGIAVGFGWFIHLMGDMITKMGVPLLWPIPWRGRMWWNFAPPSFMRITAGGAIENVIIFPALTILTIILAGWHIATQMGVL
jgi:membrane-bound metal-dependent hydrolase YbcI (DUF457 family)